MFDGTFETDERRPIPPCCASGDMASPPTEPAPEATPTGLAIDRRSTVVGDASMFVFGLPPATTPPGAPPPALPAIERLARVASCKLELRCSIWPSPAAASTERESSEPLRRTTVTVVSDPR